MWFERVHGAVTDFVLRLWVCQQGWFKKFPVCPAYGRGASPWLNTKLDGQTAEQAHGQAGFLVCRGAELVEPLVQGFPFLRVDCGLRLLGLAFAGLSGRFDSSGVSRPCRGYCTTREATGFSQSGCRAASSLLASPHKISVARALEVPGIPLRFFLTCVLEHPRSFRYLGVVFCFPWLTAPVYGKAFVGRHRGNFCLVSATANI